MKDYLKPNRRNFIKAIGISAVGAGLSQNIFGSAGKSAKGTSIEQNQIGNFKFEFLFANEEFIGLGKIWHGDTLLRSNHLPMFVSINSPDAIEFIKFKVINKVVKPDSILLEFSASQKSGGTMEWMLHSVRNRRNIGDWNMSDKEAKNLKFSLLIKAVSRKIGNQDCAGFSYQYFYENQDIPIYKITDRSSWEINGSSVNNELWMKNGVVDSCHLFKNEEEFYSTEWYLPNASNPNVFQFHPFQTQFQGFTLTSANEGTLITWATKVSHIRTLIEKWRGSDKIVHFHEHCNDLSNKFETVPMEVIWIPGQTNFVQRANLYHEMREMVHAELHAQIGMKRDRITTYGVIEEWTEPDFDNYTQNGLVKLIDAGVKTVFITNQCQNVMNEWGLSNICCTVDYIISETADEKKLTNFCKKAKENGIRVEMWGNTSVSTLTELFSHREGKEKGIHFLPVKDSIVEAIRKSAEPWVRNPSNAIEADHYTPRFCVLNLRDKDIREYWMKQWKYFHDQVGIEGIFLDSSFNLSSDKFHFQQFYETGEQRKSRRNKSIPPVIFRPENEPPKRIQTQYFAHLEWMVEMQKMGYHYCAEDSGVFGVSRTGPEIIDRLPNLTIWENSFCEFNSFSLKKSGYEPIDIFFKGLAYRIMWKLYWNIRANQLEMGINDKLAFTLLKVYNKAEEFMDERQILEDEKAVLYSRDKVSVLWSFTDFDFKLNSTRKIQELTSNADFLADSFKAQKNHVYLIN